MAIPWPPPMQSDARPKRPRRRPSSCSRVKQSRAPEAPTGCPRATALPLTFDFPLSNPSSRSTARYCAAKASFISTRSRSCIPRPARCSACREAGTGPIPMISGWTPATPHETIRPRGATPRARARLSVVTMTAGAPSLNAQLHRGDVSQRTPEVAQGRARPLQDDDGALTHAMVHSDSLVVLDEGLDAVALQPLAPFEESQLEEELRRHHDAPEALDETEGGGHGAAGGQEVVHHHDLLSLANRVFVNGEDITAILELVLFLYHPRGQLAFLAHGHEARPQLLGQGPAEDEATRLDSHHHVHRPLAVLGGQMLDHRGPGRAILEERGDVLEENAFSRKVLDIADFRSERGHIHDGRRSYA